MIGLALMLAIVLGICRLIKQNQRIDALIAAHRQPWAIADAADMATDGSEREILL